MSLEINMFLLNVLTKLSYCIELYTIEPTELKMKYVDIKQLNVNNLTSVSAYFDKAYVP
jgi:hypothetical protein